MSSPPVLAHNDHAGPSNNLSKSSSGLTFVLPPLSAVKAQKGKKKIKLTYEEPVKKQPRPIKLKPLKEVLTRLIAQIKKKDDYAFFLHPVDPAQVPGYSDVIARPMDLGTMTTKVEKGKYRSLEEFASDLKLVTTNAKTFNPPGTIYYTEAERIENYALDHIAKAAALVIEYETDWNIDVEKDDDPVAVDDEGTRGEKGTTPMDVDESRAGSPSLISAQLGGKRGKGKKAPGTLSESLEPDGGLPGAKDGLGAFPPGSDWAELMLALKIKGASLTCLLTRSSDRVYAGFSGKRYRTKKERMRMERGGPPIAADGSLDYPEMEDPFSVLSAMVPDPPSRPLLTPLYPTLEPSDPSQPLFHAPVSIIPIQEIPDPSASVAPTVPVASSSKLKYIKPKKRRHWVINRNAPSRSRAKDVAEEEVVPAWKTPREPVATDFGTFATLPSILAEERKTRDLGTDSGSEDKLFDVLRESLQQPADAPHAVKSETTTNEDSYWESRAAEAEGYIRDVVYGGVDGLAYVRSIAEFLTPSEPVERGGEPPTFGELGLPVAQWVEQNIVDPLTGGRHGVLRDAARILNGLLPMSSAYPATFSPSMPTDMITSPQSSALPFPPMSPESLQDQIALSLHTYPAAWRTLTTLQGIHAAKIDLPALIRAPDELFHAEDVWAGREYRERRKREMDEALARDPEKNAAAYLQWAIAEHREAEAGAGGFGGGGGLTGTGGTGAAGIGGGAAGGAVVEDAGMLAYALGVAADEIARLAREGGGDEDGDIAGKKEEAEADGGAAMDVSVKVEVEETEKGPDADGDIAMKTEGDDDDEDASDDKDQARDDVQEEEEESSPSPSASAPSASAASSVPASNGTTGTGTDATASENENLNEEEPAMKKLRLNLLALAKRAPLDQIMKLPPELVPAHLRHIVPTTDK
ncbi:hypothetical protein C8Q74DRAFT_364477 [Fomes fomentarius]|nr:hypothetical protein C8Q74DRAFT_364477 [Fomes fomentarius]